MPGADYERDMPEPTPPTAEDLEAQKNTRSLLDKLADRIREKGGESVELKPDGTIIEHDWKKKCGELQAQLSRLKEVLKKKDEALEIYGDHMPSCASEKPTDYPTYGPCNCGYKQSLLAEGEGK